MPHQFVNRPRFHALSGTDRSPHTQFKWESANALVYLVGGGLFILGEHLVSAGYVIGSVLFAVGSLCFLSRVGRYEAGAWCFVLGSLLFVFAATINVLQIVRADDMRTLQLMNLTALTFVTGSVLFTVGSVPYLFSFDDVDDERVVEAFLAAQFVVGSVLFLLGGIFNYRRAYLVVGRSDADASETS